MDLSQEEWIEKLQITENAVIIDVRTPEECSDGIIPNAIAIDIYKGQDFIYEIEKLDKTKSYFIYCKSGGRSAQACGVMKQLGFSETYNLLEGITQWKGSIVQG